MPTDDVLMSDDELQRRFENTKQLVEDNMKLRLRVEELSNNLGEESGLLNDAALQEQFQQALDELEGYRSDVEDLREQLQTAQKSAEFYKMKLQEEAGVGGELDQSMFVAGASQMSRVDLELELHKVKCELRSVTERLELTVEEKKRVEE